VLEIKKITKCIKCGTQTSCRNGVCALCSAGITKIYDDLRNLLKRDKNWNHSHALKKKKAG
jgi:hypothetical protein